MNNLTQQVQIYQSEDGQLINDNTLAALALLVAESKPDQKELMIRLVEHFVLLKG